MTDSSLRTAAFGLLIGAAVLAGAAQARMRSTDADGDGDGRISHAEFTASSDARFNRIDTNHDGKLDKAEAAAALAALGGR